MVAIIPVSPAPNPVGPDAEKVGEDALVATADGPTIRSMGLLPEGEIDPTKDAIFFRQRKYFIGESAGTVRVDVLRVGCLEGSVTVDYETVKEKSVMAGGANDYKTVSGTLEFNPGETFQSFDVPIVSDNTWETMESFKVQLKDGSLNGPGVISHPKVATVYLVDDDQYPQNLKPGFSRFDFYTGFVKERWQTRWPKPPKTILCMLYATVHGLFSIFIPKMLIDFVINSERDADGKVAPEKYVLAYALGGAYAFSALIYWHLDYKHVDIRGNSGTRKDLRNWIMRKYVWFSESTHNNKIGDMTVVNCMVNQVEELVIKGWYGSSLFIAAVFDLVCSSILVYFMGWKALVPLAILFPAVLIIFQCRSPVLVRLLQTRVKRERAWLSLMDDAMDNWPLVNAYGLRDTITGDFKKTYEQFYKDHRKSRFYQTNSEWGPRYINELCIVAIFVLGTHACIDGQLTVGEFSALVSLFRRIGRGVIRVNLCLVNMMRSTVALDDIARILNMPTGVVKHVEREKEESKRATGMWGSLKAKVKKDFHKPGGQSVEKVLSDWTHKATSFLDFGNSVKTTPDDGDAKKSDPSDPTSPSTASSRSRRASFNKRKDSLRFQFDRVGNSKEQIVALNVIEIQNCTYKYNTEGLDGHVPVCTKLNVSIPLGKMIWMTNGADPSVEGLGRLTLMKLMSGLLLPDKGHINVPAHLNVLFVHHEPMLLAKSLWANLTLGNPDAKEEEVWKIATKMGMSQSLVGKSDLDVGDHGNNLRMCDKQAICLARAVIANPDVLLLHRPGELFTESDKHNMLDGIKEWMGTGRYEGGSHATILQTKTAILSIDDDADEKVPRNCNVVCKVSEGAAELFEVGTYTEKYLSNKKTQ